MGVRVLMVVPVAALLALKLALELVVCFHSLDSRLAGDWGLERVPLTLGDECLLHPVLAVLRLRHESVLKDRSDGVKTPRESHFALEQGPEGHLVKSRVEGLFGP